MLTLDLEEGIITSILILLFINFIGKALVKKFHNNYEKIVQNLKINEHKLVLNSNSENYTINEVAYSGQSENTPATKKKEAEKFKQKSKLSENSNEKESKGKPFFLSEIIDSDKQRSQTNNNKENDFNFLLTGVPDHEYNAQNGNDSKDKSIRVSDFTDRNKIIISNE